MGSGGLAGSYIASAGSSFKMICLHLLELAYCEVLDDHIVTSEWTENAISEVLVSRFNANPETTSRYITAIVEKRLLNGSLFTAPLSVDDAPRIDILIGGFTSAPDVVRIQYFIEAKNLYCQNFIKAGNTSPTPSTAYAKRYVTTGIDNILKGHYPSDTLLLGYVLNGTVLPAVDKINNQLVKDARKGEVISTFKSPSFSSFLFGASNHPNGLVLEHCFLQF